MDFRGPLNYSRVPLNFDERRLIFRWSEDPRFGQIESVVRGADSSKVGPSVYSQFRLETKSSETIEIQGSLNSTLENKEIEDPQSVAGNFVENTLSLEESAPRTALSIWPNRGSSLCPKINRTR